MGEESIDRQPDERLRASEIEWERRDEIGLFRAFCLTTRAILIEPDKTYRKLKPGAGYGGALLYAFLGGGVGVFGFALTVFLCHLMFFTERSNQSKPTTDLSAVLNLLWRYAPYMISAPFVSALGVTVVTALIHVYLKRKTAPQYDLYASLEGIAYWWGSLWACCTFFVFFLPILAFFITLSPALFAASLGLNGAEQTFEESLPVATVTVVAIVFLEITVFGIFLFIAAVGSGMNALSRLQRVHQEAAARAMAFALYCSLGGLWLLFVFRDPLSLFFTIAVPILWFLLPGKALPACTLSVPTSLGKPAEAPPKPSDSAEREETNS